MTLQPLPRWIFFDCFNTLLDDFDTTGDESGMAPVRHIPVEAGFYTNATEFRTHYDTWRKKQQGGNGHAEIQLPQRLRALLRERAPEREPEIEPLVSAILSEFKKTYPPTVRPTPGAKQMLEAFQGHVKMAVVSNFVLPGWPERLLAAHGLSKHFEFVLDSAAFGWKKPDARIYIEALRQAGISRDCSGQVLFIGDNLKNDVLTPQQLGMQALYLDRSADRLSLPPPQNIPTLVSWKTFRPHAFDT